MVWRTVALILIAVISVNSNSNAGNNSTSADTRRINNVETRIRQTLNTHYNLTGVDSTVMLTSESGATFEHNTGLSNPLTIYRSASTSKWVTAAVILYLVDTGVMSLDDKPQDTIDFWPTRGNLAKIELHHLLSFTSGLTVEPSCVNLPNSDFEGCVETIKTQNRFNSPLPGNEFYYSPTHMQVAGLMAIKASGYSTWTEVFDYFKTQTKLFSKANYSLPSTSNPRLAGGMEWSAKEYMAFLVALYQEQFLSSNTTELMFSNQLVSATIGYSAAEDLGFAWPYGFGNWIECDPSVDCNNVKRVSSIGTYGAYPFIDYEYDYMGLIARDGGISTADEGYDVYNAIADDLATWATLVKNNVTKTKRFPRR